MSNRQFSWPECPSYQESPRRYQKLRYRDFTTICVILNKYGEFCYVPGTMQYFATRVGRTEMASVFHGSFEWILSYSMRCAEDHSHLLWIYFPSCSCIQRHSSLFQALNLEGSLTGQDQPVEQQRKEMECSGVWETRGLAETAWESLPEASSVVTYKSLEQESLRRS